MADLEERLEATRASARDHVRAIDQAQRERQENEGVLKTAEDALDAAEKQREELEGQQREMAARLSAEVEARVAQTASFHQKLSDVAVARQEQLDECRQLKETLERVREEKRQRDNELSSLRAERQRWEADDQARSEDEEARQRRDSETARMKQELADHKLQDAEARLQENQSKLDQVDYTSS